MGAALNPLADGSELHNLVVEDGRARVRQGFAQHTSIPGSTGRIVFGFSVPNPRTSEVWHYLFVQDAAGVVTLTVSDEEFRALFSVDLGAMAVDPVITYGVANNQLMVNSPAFSVPLYGIVGQGLIPALKTVSPDPYLSTIDVPTGHIAAWRNRFAIAAGNVLYVNSGELDPRTFPAKNAISLPGQILDLFEGPDGGLWIFTTRDAYVIPADALSQSQISVGFMTTIPNVSTSNPRNAVPTAGTVLALVSDGTVQVSTSGQTKTDVSPYEGRRYFTPDTRVPDLRACRVYRTPSGAVVSFGGLAPVFLVVDLRNGFRSYWSLATATGFDTRNVVGVLRTREGAPLFLLAPSSADGVTASLVLENIGNGTVNLTDDVVRGFVCVRSPLAADASPVARFVTVNADNPGGSSFVYLAGSASTITTPTLPTDAVVGTSTWSASASLAERDKRTMRHAFAVRLHDVEIEMGIDGVGASFDAGDILFRGQGRNRRTRP